MNDKYFYFGLGWGSAFIVAILIYSLLSEPLEAKERTCGDYEWNPCYVKVVEQLMAKKLAFKVYYDENSGEISDIKPTKRFEAEGHLFKIDVLLDASILIEKIYKYERDVFFKEFDQNHIIGES